MKDSLDSSALLKEHICAIEEAIISTNNDIQTLHRSIHEHQKQAGFIDSELVKHSAELSDLKH